MAKTSGVLGQLATGKAPGASSVSGRFEMLCLFAERYSNLIPLTFVLGFYVSLIVTRWWDLFMLLAWIDDVALAIASYVVDGSEQCKILRRSMVRYLTLCETLVLVRVSTAVKKRFPTERHLLESGLLTQPELEEMNTIISAHPKYWLPIRWCNQLVMQARRNGWIESDLYVVELHQKINAFRTAVGVVFCYDWMSVPLVYTQVVNLAVRSYFVVCLFGRQYLDPAQGYPNSEVDYYIPPFTILQFLFYVGWLKVAEVLINPMGEDDDDFELNYLLDRNVQRLGLAPDVRQWYVPQLQRDLHWDDTLPEMPHTAASAEIPVNPLVGSAAEVCITEQQAEVAVKTASHSSLPHAGDSRFGNQLVPQGVLPARTEATATVKRYLSQLPSRLFSRARSKVSDCSSKTKPYRVNRMVSTLTHGNDSGSMRSRLDSMSVMQRNNNSKSNLSINSDNIATFFNLGGHPASGHEKKANSGKKATGTAHNTTDALKCDRGGRRFKPLQCTSRAHPPLCESTKQSRAQRQTSQTSGGSPAHSESNLSVVSGSVAESNTIGWAPNLERLVEDEEETNAAANAAGARNNMRKSRSSSGRFRRQWIGEYRPA